MAYILPSLAASNYGFVISVTAFEAVMTTGPRTIAVLKALSEEDYAHLTKVRPADAALLIDKLIPPPSAHTVIGPFLSIAMAGEREVIVWARSLRPRFARELDLAEVMCS